MQTDRDILRAIRERAPAPVIAGELAETCGIPMERVEVRMRSLVSLHYVDLIAGAYVSATGEAFDGRAVLSVEDGHADRDGQRHDEHQAAARAAAREAGAMSDRDLVAG
jgi:hypothetical protein